MDQIVIQGIPPWDGSYDFDLERQPLTTREWGWIADHSTYLPLTIEDGFGDPRLLTVFAAIALRRAGKIDARQFQATFDQLADAPFGETISLQTETADEGTDAGPPDITKSSSSSNGSSGADSMASEPSADTPKVSGTPALASSELAPERLAT